MGVTPLAYQLDLTVMPERETFTGRVRIDIRFDAATDGFWIHGRGLDVDNVSLRTGDAVVAATYQQVTRDGVVRISLERPIDPQTAQLDISYHARFSNLLEGLYHVTGGWRVVCVHAVRADRRARRVSGIRRAAFQDSVHAEHRRAEGRNRRRQHADRRDRNAA